MILFPLLLSFLSIFLLAAASSSSFQSFTIASLSLSSSTPNPAPKPFAHLLYDPTTLTANLTSYTPPSSVDRYYRIGLLSSAAALGPNSVLVPGDVLDSTPATVELRLHVGANGEVSGIGVGKTAEGGRVGGGDRVLPRVDVLPPAEAPMPVLNRPVVLREGRVMEEPPEKTMLQKYWWVGAGMLLIVFMGGGGDK